MHMMLEPLLLFEAVLLENLPVTQFIHSDFIPITTAKQSVCRTRS